MTTECGKNGLILAALSSLVFAVCSLIAKQLNNVHPIQLCLYGFLGVALFSLVQVVISGVKIVPRGYAILILVRSLCGCSSFVLGFYSVQILPLGDASVLLYTTPLWTLILARLFLQEPCKTSNLILIGIAMIGVIFVTQPEIVFGKDDTSIEISQKYTVGAVTAIIASISEATGNVVLRKLKNIDPCVILFNYSMFSVFFCFICGISFDLLCLSVSNMLPIGVLSVLIMTEQYLMALALSLEDAGPVAIIQASDIIYGYVLEVLFYNEKINTFSMLGAILVAVVVYRMAVSKLPSQPSTIV